MILFGGVFYASIKYVLSILAHIIYLLFFYFRARLQWRESPPPRLANTTPACRRRNPSSPNASTWTNTKHCTCTPCTYIRMHELTHARSNLRPTTLSLHTYTFFHSLRSLRLTGHNDVIQLSLSETPVWARTKVVYKHTDPMPPYIEDWVFFIYIYVRVFTCTHIRTRESFQTQLNENTCINTCTCTCTCESTHA